MQARTRNMSSFNTDANQYDRVLRMLETTRRQKQKISSSPRLSRRTASNWTTAGQESDDNSTFDSRNESATLDTIVSEADSHTRQSLVDRSSQDDRPNSVESFIARSTSAGTEIDVCVEGTVDNKSLASGSSRLLQEPLPKAILKLDRRIPRPRHPNDVLIEIEASTVDRRDCMYRDGVRCCDSFPVGVQTQGMDCVGRVVQLTAHSRAIYGISIDDRVAGIYPFAYKDCTIDKTKNSSSRYVLLDAGLVTTVPKHVDAAEAACITRVYLTAFQAIQSGYTRPHDRYGMNQLEGATVLIQHGETELGKALICLVKLLGCTQIYATSSGNDNHPLLAELGATALGEDSFRWELFCEKGVDLCLIQEMPTSANFDSYLGVLDAKDGSLVYLHPYDKKDEEYLGSLTSAGCNWSMKSIKEKAKEAYEGAKFSVRLTCSPNFVVFEGVWSSYKNNGAAFRQDLRFLFDLLGQNLLRPHVKECVEIEDIEEVQNRVEVTGKDGTIVCLPTALYEKKSKDVIAERHIPSNNKPSKIQTQDHFSDYAALSGYVQPVSPMEVLEDFHEKVKIKEEHQSPKIRDLMHQTQQQTDPAWTPNDTFWRAGANKPFSSKCAISPSNISGNISATGTVATATQSAYSDGVTIKPYLPLLEAPPQSISIRKKRARALRRRREAQTRWKHQDRPAASERDEQSISDETIHSESACSAPTSPSNQTTSRKIRREARRMKTERMQKNDTKASMKVTRQNDVVLDSGRYCILSSQPSDEDWSTRRLRTANTQQGGKVDTKHTSQGHDKVQSLISRWENK